jgi:hypothetical protein
MKKAIVLIIALVVLPLNFALAAPAGSGQSDLRAQLEQAQAQKAEHLTVIAQEASLMTEALSQSKAAPLPAVSLEVKNTNDASI